MQSDPLLTQDELDFIQKILFKPPQKRRPDAAPPLALGKRLSELLARLGNEEQLSLDTHTDNQHLSFPLHLIQDDHSQSRLELGAPLIFEQGVNERPWRLALTTALTLLDSSDQPSGLKALELSNNGILVEYAKQARRPRISCCNCFCPRSAAFNCAHSWQDVSARRVTPTACRRYMKKMNRPCVSTCSNSTADNSRRPQQSADAQ